MLVVCPHEVHGQSARLITFERKEPGMQRPLTALCWVMLLCGVFLLAAAVLHSLEVARLFSEPPWILGVALASIGGLLLGTRRK